MNQGVYDLLLYSKENVKPVKLRFRLDLRLEMHSLLKKLPMAGQIGPWVKVPVFLYTRGLLMLAPESSCQAKGG